MKKLLTILGAVGLMATTGATVVACGPNDKEEVKGDFKLKGDTKVDVTKEITIGIDDFDNVKKTWTDFKVVIETKDGKTDLITYGDISEKGEVTIKGEKPGEVTLHFSAEKVKNPETFAGEEPTEPAGKSAPITIKVSAQDIKNIIPAEKLDLGDSKTAEAKAKVEAILNLPEINLFDKVEIGEPTEKGETGSIIVKAKDANKDTVIGSVTFTYKVLPA